MTFISFPAAHYQYLSDYEGVKAIIKTLKNMLLENFQITEAALYRMMNGTTKNKKPDRDKGSVKNETGKVNHKQG